MRIPDRPIQGRLIAGVCVAIGEYWAIDIMLIRLAFMLLTFAWGLGLLIYGILWLIMPDVTQKPAGSFRESAHRNILGLHREIGQSAKRFSTAWRRQDQSNWPRPLSKRWIAIILVFAGSIIVLSSLGVFSWLNPLRAIGLAGIVFGIAILLNLKQN